MLRNWRLEVLVNAPIVNNLKDSTIKTLKRKFGNIMVLRRTITPSFVINNNIEVVITPNAMDIFCDDEKYLKNLDIQYILGVCYNSPVILRVDIGTKILVSCEDELKVAKKLNSIVQNSVYKDAVTLSSSFALVKDDDIIVYTVVLNNKGYHLQLEIDGINIDEIGKKIDDIIHLKNSQEVKNMLNVEEV